MKWGHENFYNSGGGTHDNEVLDGMIESASMDIKNELKKSKNELPMFRFLNVAFDQLVRHQQV